MTTASPWRAFARYLRRPGTVRRTGVVGTMAALTLATIANLVAARLDHRWDLTSDARYTPSQPLLRTLARIPRPVTAVVLLGRGDPLAPTLEQLLQSYRNVTANLQIDWVDPDRDPVRYLARQSELGIRVGKTADGQVTTDALVVLASGSNRYYLTPEDVTGLDPEHSDSTATFEHAFAVGLSSLFRAKKPDICFSTGHRELSLSDQSPIGLSLFKERLERDDLTTRTIEPAVSSLDALKSCRVIVVASPDVPLTERAVSNIRDAVTSASTNLLLLGGIVPDANGKLISLGFEPLAQLGGIAITPSVVIEADERYRLPNLFGETFFATPTEHSINRALVRSNGDPPLRIVVALGSLLTTLSGGDARPLLTASDQSFAVTDMAQLSATEGGHGGTKPSRHVVAMAGTIERHQNEPNRLVLMPTNLVQNRTFDSPALSATQAFTESVVSWLSSSPTEAIELVPRTKHVTTLELSDSEMAELIRYILFVMPSAVLLMAVAVYLRRRRDGRVESKGKKKEESGP